jgi:hypothetical protein
MFQIKVLEKTKTQILFSIISFAENRAVYEILSKNLVKPEGPQVTSQYGAPTHKHARTHSRAHTHIQTNI